MTNKIRPRTFLLSGALLLAAASLAPAATPANLARSDAGARLALFASSNTGDSTTRAAQALLSEGDPLGCSLAAGTTTILLSLPQAGTLHRFDFLNLTAAGKVFVAVSNVALPPESPRWRALPAAGQEFGTPDEVVTCELGHVEARHLRITFETQAPGRIDTFGLFGAGTESAFTSRPRLVAYETVSTGARPAGVPAAGARVLRVSSGSGSPEAIVDGSLAGGHAFAASDRHPTTLIDLGGNRTLSRVNLACRTRTAGRLDLYLFANRKDAEAALPPAGRQPDATARVESRAGLSRFTLPVNAGTARFLAVVFVPESGDAPLEAKDFKDSRDYKGGGGNGGNAPDDAGFASSRPPATGTGNLPPDGTFVLTEVTPVGTGVTGPGDFTSTSILPPGTASNTFFNPGSSSPVDTPVLPPAVGNGIITP